MKNILLGSIFAILNLVIYLIYEIITSDIDYYFNKRDPYFLYMIVSSILFPIFLFLFEYRKKRKYFYLFFYIWWVVTTFIIIGAFSSYFEIIYLEKYERQILQNEDVINYILIKTYKSVIVVSALIPRWINFCIFIISFSLLRKYVE
ncbi:hypothetical protein RCZ16_25150 [Capnocytophaga catalasegens]|uniref:Uncharacterized protein n=1 Tax=Capnocytophaga catalasegens TaxID=1004260 RepID=A0ABQ4VQZ4_9FLAO|nr:hypothetical protein RCZ03_03700 [Capnocytophaga catalasegens]GJM54199.1 hypothetical protein RCZ16_25150 [Capnocytophaga catalasegens]